MDPRLERQYLINRRHFFGKSATGIGVAALASLLGEDALASEEKVMEAVSHFAPKAKRVIYLFQNGAPSHVELFDHKPRLAELHGEPVPPSYMEGKRFSTMSAAADKRKLLAPLEAFKQHGESGAWVSSLMPHTAKVVDDLCFVKSMHTEQVNHAPAINFFLSGFQLPGRPTVGSWLSYGLGTMNANLPTFVVMTSVTKDTSCGQIFYDSYWSSGFLPSRHQGVKLRAGNSPVLYLNNPKGVDGTLRRKMLNGISKLNEAKLADFGDPEIATRIAQYEMAYRMQTSVPELADISGESKATLDLYGPQVHEPGTFARNCLLARRLVERGTRFVQLMHAGWDQHNSLTTELYNQCRDTDQPSAGLITDLKQRGLLDDTLVIWGGEFGRTPFLQGDISNRPKWGRDHHPYAFTVWMAGGGVKPGISYGESDDIGFNVTKDPVHIHDFHATLLHLLGVDHEKLTFKFQGRHYRLTDVHGHVVKDILA
ncbi:sulfatase [Haloferula helveola]|uniref:Sulfatase n=1 Tax=Haloferula helveola TaxID=490095 RepID=A0ABM7R8P5_9BACT|nr:sulfatase [Haloferula helveola]